MDYVLRVSSYAGLLPWARHFRGRVQGEHPQSCHGATTFNAPEARGKTTCSEGHEIPRQIEWDVDAFWTEAQHTRWSADHYEGDGPAQFTDETRLIETAVRRFKGEREHQWWEEDYPRPQPGDRLFLGYVPWEGDETDEDGHGSLLAEIPAAEEKVA